MGCFDRADRLQSDPAFQLLHQGYEKIAASKPGEAESLFSQIVQNHASSEAAGEAALRLAYLKWAASLEASDEPSRNALRADSRARFEAIARGEVKSSPAVRIEAMHRCARIYHGKKERIRALQAYQEIAALTDSVGSPDPDVHLEIAGLYMELALSENGSLENCIRECDQVLAIPGASDRTCATALQMKAEAFHFLKDYKASIDLERKILEEYPDCKSMAMLANFYMGLSYFQINDPYRAQNSFEKVVKDFSDNDNLPGNDLRFASKLYMAQALIRMEKRRKARRLLKEIIIEKPASKQAEDARKLYELIKPDAE